MFLFLLGAFSENVSVSVGGVFREWLDCCWERFLMILKCGVFSENEYASVGACF